MITPKLLIKKTLLDGVVRITPPTLHTDERGRYTELYNEELYKVLGVKFIQDDISVSVKNVIRGFHGDYQTWKLISCLHGTIQVKIVNNISGHEQEGMVLETVLHGAYLEQLLIPPGYGNAHGVITDMAIFHYKQSTYYDRKSQFTLPWNGYGPWVIKEPILSERDASAGR